jgi:hypothetical protein
MPSTGRSGGKRRANISSFDEIDAHELLPGTVPHRDDPRQFSCDAAAFLIQVNVYLIKLYLRLATSTYREVEMSSSKMMTRLIATMLFLSMGLVLYPQGSANAAKFCAELRGATATGKPDCSYTSHAACRKVVRAGGGGHCYKLRP